MELREEIKRDQEELLKAVPMFDAGAASHAYDLIRDFVGDSRYVYHFLFVVTNSIEIYVEDQTLTTSKNLLRHVLEGLDSVGIVAKGSDPEFSDSYNSWRSKIVVERGANLSITISCSPSNSSCKIEYEDKIVRKIKSITCGDADTEKEE